MAQATIDHDLLTDLRVHQRTAVDMCVNAFATGAPRLTLQAACGTGKTLIALNVAQEVAPAGRVLTVLPRLQLLEQTVAAWHADQRKGPFLALCSEGPQDPALAGVMRRFSRIDDLAEQIAATGGGPVNVFTTYQSLHKLAQGHAGRLLPAWDLIIGDEAHRAAGSLNKKWAVIHDNDAIPSCRRLYMTATPKNVANPEDNPELACEVASMDDLSLYGPVVYRISLAGAIQEGLLADYRLVVMEIHDEHLRRILGRNCDISHDVEGLRVAAAQVALLYAMRTYNLTRTLSFHSRIKSAEIFAETLHETAALMPEGAIGNLWTGTVSSQQDRFDRLATFAQFAGYAPDSPEALRRVLTNSRLCQEGVDLPAIDSILFADPKSSTIDIVQAVGRALRQPPGTGKIATIIVPVYLAPGEDPAMGMRGSPYWLLYQVMIALRVYDEHVVHRVEHLELEDLEETRFRPPAVRPERADEIIPVLALNAFDPHHSVWPMGLASAERYHAQHGHLDVPSRYLGPDRFYLGWWLGHQRCLRLNGLLREDRVDALDAYGMRWEHPRHSIEFRLQVAREYAATYGHLAPLADETFQGTRIGRWMARCKQEAHDGTWPRPYERALGEIDPWWNAPWPKRWQHTYVRALAAARAGALDFPGLHVTADTLAIWLDQQIDLMPELHPDQRNLLGALPFDHPLALLLRRPRSPAERAFAEGLRAARAFRREYRHLDVPYDHVVGQAGRRFRLGEWISRQRRDAAQLTRGQLDALQALHMRWIPRQRSFL